MDERKFAEALERASVWVRALLRAHARLPRAVAGAPGRGRGRDGALDARGGRGFRRPARRLRAHRRSRHHALELSALFRLLLDHGLGAGCACRVARRGAQRQRDAVADVAGGDRGRRGRAQMAARRAGPAGELLRRRVRHRKRLGLARARGRPRIARPGRAQSRHRRPRSPACASTAPTRLTRTSKRTRSCSALGAKT